MAVSSLFRSKRRAATMATCFLCGFGLVIIGCSKKQSPEKVALHTADKTNAKTESFQDEPAAHALYNQMIEALRKADSLSYVGHYMWETKGQKRGDLVLGECTYRMWLKKPNYFRVETESSRGKGGILIGDGNNLWIYWPQGRPRFSSEESDESEAEKKARFTCYMKKSAPLGRHSISHEVGLLGAGLCMTIIDLSTFHGYTDSLQPYLDGVKNLGTEKVGDEQCDKIEVSIMKHQRSWYLWLSQRDHLPRKLKEITRVSYDIVTHEQWSAVTINADLPETLFAWKPPEDWTQWRLPSPEERLLKPGVKAPEFKLVSAEGKQIRLADFRNQIVWLYIWRAG
jgi:outer membrane lipoprotein-sorting protein